MLSTKTYIYTSVTSKKLKSVSVCVCVCVRMQALKAVRKPIRVMRLLHKLLCSFLEGTEKKRVQKAFNKFQISPFPKKLFGCNVPPSPQLVRYFACNNVNCPESHVQ